MKNITVFHHYDPKKYPLLISYFQKIGFLFLKKNLKKIDKIIVVSKYWREFLIKKGFNERKIKVIYNPFEISKYIDITKTEVIKFKHRYNLLNKPIIYIGNPQKIKGTDRVYEILKDMDVYLVTSGKKNMDISSCHLDLSFEDYILLLHASSIVILMSRFKEGWNRVAHEAMLCKTPVIGSGKGGLGELLHGGGQIICDFSSLKNEVENMLNNQNLIDDLGIKGQNFTKKFTVEKFINEWKDCIEEVCI
jgi:glycosyltransferase involved in cell wall biosynthesis